MINSTINDESFRLKITEIGLRKLLIDKGSIEVLSYITSLYDEKNNEYIKFTDAEKDEYLFKHHELNQSRVIHDQFEKDKVYLDKNSENKTKLIEKWIFHLNKMVIPTLKMRAILICSKLWIDESVELDLNELVYVCHSFKLISTCALCENGQFIGDGNYCNNKFTNCLADVPRSTELYEKCTSFEMRHIENE